MRMLIRFPAFCLAAAALLAPISASQAHHHFLQRAFPAPNVHVAPVQEVKLVFEGKADAVASTLKLKNLDGSVVAEMTQARASKEMVLPTPTLAPGEYMVEYRVLATDGELVKGGFFFTVDRESV